MIQNEPLIHRSDMIRCTLCLNPPCDDACKKMNPGSLLRSVWFRNEQTAALRLPPENPCPGCSAPCEAACVRAGEVPIRKLTERLYNEVRPECETPLPEMAEKRGDASWISRVQMVLKQTPAQPASKARAHIS